MDLHRVGDHAYDKDRDVLDDGDMDREPTAHDVLAGGDMDRDPTAHDVLEDGDMDHCHVSKVLGVWDDHVLGELDE